MPTQNINASISAADLQAVKDAFAAVLNKLPFLVNLTQAERRSAVRAGAESLSFIINALTAAKDHSTILPASFDISAFQKDVELFELLIQLDILAASVASQINDTKVAVGAEAMKQATHVYSYVKTGAKTTPGLKPVAEQLSERFRKAGKKKESPKPTP